MDLSTEQMKALVGMGRSRHRHWKKCLEPIAGRDGRSATFTVQEVLALKVVAFLVDRSSVEVGKLKPISVALFKACELSWPLLQGLVLIVDTHAGTVEHRSRGERPLEYEDVEGKHIIPLDRLAARLKEELTPDPEGQQADLKFPPMPVRKRG